jgi:hypothetical protein
MSNTTRGDSVPRLLAAAAELYAEKNRVYGDNYLHFGHIMSGLYPEGVELTTEQDWTRMGIILNLVTCLSRYCHAPRGHVDSARDLTVYAAMLQELTPP